MRPCCPSRCSVGLGLGLGLDTMRMCHVEPHTTRAPLAILRTAHHRLLLCRCIGLPRGGYQLIWHKSDNVYLILVKTHNQTFRKTYGTHSGKNMLEVQCTVGWRQAFKNYVSNVFAGLEMRDRVAPRTRQGQRHRGSSNAQRARRGLANSPETCLKKKTVTAGRSMLNLRCATGGCEEGRDGGWRRLVAAPRGCTTCVHGKQAMR